MEMQQHRWLEDHSATPQTRWVHEKGAETGDKAIGSAQVGSLLPTAIQDEDLMPSERRFRDDSTKATRFHKPDDGDDRMNENDDDVEHAGIVSNLKNSQNSGRFCNSPPTRRLLRDFMNSPGTTQELAGTWSTLVCTYTSPDARWSS